MKSIRNLKLGMKVGFLALALSSACTAHKKPSTVETALANMVKDIVIPIETGDLKNPLPNNSPVVSQGREIYLQSCAICHGTDGHGQTDMGYGMYPPVMDLTSPAFSTGAILRCSGLLRTG